MSAVRAATLRVLAIGGLDPSGAAGIVADITTLAQHDCRPGALVTTHTAQGLTQWGGQHAVDSFVFRNQAQMLCGDARWDAVKIGALGSAEVATEVSLLLRALREQQPDLPVVIDPVLRSSSGGTLGRVEWLAELQPWATLLCPNREEHRALGTGSTSASTYTLITDEPPGAVLFQHGDIVAEFSYSRRPGSWRGTGCRLSSLLAVALARGLDVPASAAWALDTLQQRIQHAALTPATDPGHFFL